MNTQAVIYEFGRFRLDLFEQRLLRDQETIPLPPKVLDTLVVLVKHSGHILSKDEIMTAVWPNTFVEESSLTQNISLLRKALNGEDQRFIETVPKRGYRFVAPVKVVDGNNGGMSGAADAIVRVEDQKPGDEGIDRLPLAPNDNQAGVAIREAFGTSLGEQRVRPAGRSVRISVVVLLLLAAGLGGGYLWQLRNQRQRKSQLEQRPRDMNKRYAQNVAASRHYTMGIYFWNKRTKEGLSKAEAYFRQAIEEDPNYAPAYASLSDVHLLAAYYGYDLLPIKEAYQQSRQMAMKAVELDNTLSEAHTAIATIEAFEGDAAGAEESYRRAINLNPNSDTAHLRYGNFLVDRSRLGEAIEELRRAQDINPVSPTNATALGSFLLFAGQYDQSVEYSKLALEIDPQFGFARDNLAAAYALKGMYGEAIEQFTALSQQPEFCQYGEVGLAWVSARMGRTTQARLWLAKLESEARCGHSLPDLPFDIAVVLSALRDEDQALAWLQTAAAKHRLRLHQLEYTTELSNLKDDSRFIQIVRLVRESKPPLSELAEDTD